MFIFVQQCACGEVSEYRLIKIECNGRMVEFSGVIYAIGVVHHAICQFGICYPDNHDFYWDGYGWGNGC